MTASASPCAATFDRRTEAAAAIVDWTAQHGLAYLPAGAERALGELSGFTIDIRATPAHGKVNLVAQLRDAPGASVSLPRDELRQGGLGFVRMLENRVATLPRLLADTESRHAAAVTTAQEAELSIRAPFKHADELAAARQRAVQVNAQVAERTKTEDQRARAEHAVPPAADGTLREKLDRVRNAQTGASSSRDLEPPRAPVHRRGLRLQGVTPMAVGKVIAANEAALLASALRGRRSSRLLRRPFRHIGPDPHPFLVSNLFPYQAQNGDIQRQSGCTLYTNCASPPKT